MSEKPRVTFFSKKNIKCPSCYTEIQREEMQTGRGRINAGELTQELRRLYIPTQKYGIVNPLLYPIVVCPSCYFAGMVSDFSKISEEMIEGIKEGEDNRHKIIQNFFGGDLDFTDYRSDITGLASYILGLISTIYLPPEASPTARRGLYALRGAWLAHDIFEKNQSNHFKEIRDSLYFQSYLNYDRCLERQLKNQEPFDGFIWMGPDVDTNFGYDGLLYIIAFLTIKHLDTFDGTEKIVRMGGSKRILSKVFGVGKSFKDKPEVLVTLSKNLYVKATSILEKLAAQGVDTSIADDIENQEDSE